WRSDRLEAQISFAGIAIADLDGNGKPEIVFGRQVLDANGKILWTGTGGRGGQNNGGIGLHSIVADLDLDGHPEVVAGNTAYYGSGPKAGQILWQNKSLPDGFTAVANFDSDPNPEIVLVASGNVYLLEHDGSVKWGPVGI